jgi:hypothetical protein
MNARNTVPRTTASRRLTVCGSSSGRIAKGDGVSLVAWKTIIPPPTTTAVTTEVKMASGRFRAKISTSASDGSASSVAATAMARVVGTVCTTLPSSSVSGSPIGGVAGTAFTYLWRLASGYPGKIPLFAGDTPTARQLCPRNFMATPRRIAGGIQGRNASPHKPNWKHAHDLRREQLAGHSQRERVSRSSVPDGGSSVATRAGGVAPTRFSSTSENGLSGAGARKSGW